MRSHKLLLLTNYIPTIERVNKRLSFQQCFFQMWHHRECSIRTFIFRVFCIISIFATTYANSRANCNCMPIKVYIIPSQAANFTTP